MAENNKENKELSAFAAYGAKIGTSLGAKLRSYFLAGVVVSAPIGITIYLAWAMIDFVDSKVTGLLPAKYNPQTYFQFGLPGLGVLIFIAAMIMLGAFTAGYAGRLFHRFSDEMLNRMPVIRGIYGAVKQIMETLFAKQSNAFREAVMVEYPRRGIWSIGFVTGNSKGEPHRMTGVETVSIFIPTTPNPTSGFILFASRKDLKPLSMTVEEAFKLVISGGIVMPKDQAPGKRPSTPRWNAGPKRRSRGDQQAKSLIQPSRR